MDELLDYPHLVFPDTDKGLGPCAVEFTQYVRDCLAHLRNGKVYQRLTNDEASKVITELHMQILDWLDKYKRILPKFVPKFILHHMKENADSPYGQFYILYKIHKGLKQNGSWPTHPVCSDVSSMPHGLEKYGSLKC